MPSPRREPERPRAQIIDARIIDVIDGDTVKVRAFGARRRFYTVRVLGIDTPETRRPGVAVECGGREATSSAWQLGFADPVDADGDGLLDDADGDGRSVVLTTDPTQDVFDGFDRLLAYVALKTGVDFGRRQIRRGWAETYVFDQPFRRVRSYRRTERGADRARRGVWEMCGGNFHTPADA